MLYKPHKLFLWITLISGSIFLFANQPFYGPDESHHFTRVIALSEGHLTSDAYAPSSYNEFIDVYTHPHAYNPLAIALQADHHDMVPINHFTRANVYSPAAYISTLPFVWLALHLHASPLVMLYIVRAIIFLSSTLLIYYAIRISPTLQWPLFFIALYPAIILVRSCINADPLTMGYAFLFIALINQQLFLKNIVRPKDILKLCILSVLLCLSKIIYCLIPCLILLLPRKRFASIKQYGIAIISVIIFPLILDAGWLYMASHAHQAFHHGTDINTQVAEGVDATGQFLFCLHHPVFFLYTIWHSWQASPEPVIYQFLAGRNAHDMIQPVKMVIPSVILLLLLPFTIPAAEYTLSWQKRGFCVALFIASALLIYFSLYATWDPVGAPIITGMQGRYFAPVLPLLLMALAHTFPEKNYPPLIKFTVAFTLLLIINGLVILRFHEYPS